ncbi:MAG: hypothetical protein IK078_10185 [Lachnospiraceae bacterium]|nr:hypothetical protein [Lachnospiraceae bacterium]
MKKRIVVLLCCMVVGLSSCGQNKTEEVTPDATETAAETESAQTAQEDAVVETDQTEEVKEDAAADQTENAEADTAADVITEDQALEAIKQYCFVNNPDLEEMVNSDEYNIFWEADTNEAGQIVVLFRSYTGSENRYYIDPKTGDTYGTELVPGIIDEEQRTEESFNVRDYMSGATATGETGAAGADADKIAKEIEEIAGKSGNLGDELAGVNELYDKYDQSRMDAPDQASMNEQSQVGTLVWKSETESLLKRIQDIDPKNYEEVKREYDQWEKYVPVMAERMSYLYEDGSIYPMIYSYNEAMRYKQKAYSLTSTLADLKGEEFVGFPDYTRCGYYGDYASDSYLVITEGMESGSYNILIHVDDTKELRGWGVVEDAPDSDTYLLFTSDDDTVKGIVGHSSFEASFYETEADYPVAGPEGAYTFPLKY